MDAADDGLRLRAGSADDAGRLVALFAAAVHGLAGSHYDAAQRDAWAPAGLDATDWRPRLARQHVLIAEAAGVPAGFIAWSDDGYIDLLFTGPGFARRGVATMLYRAAEQQLRAAGVAVATAHASHLSRPLFAREGWTTAAMQIVDRDGVAIERFRMHKRLRGD